MFIRKKKNKSGSISVQIIDKIRGKYRVIKTIGSSSESEQVNQLVWEAKQEQNRLQKSLEFNFHQDKEKELVDLFFNGIEKLELIGPELVLGKIFDKIGFNRIDEELFRALVITRLTYPVSKLKTTEYLFRSKGIAISVYSIYRYLDKLHSKQMEQVQQIAYDHTRKISEDQLSVVFYDVTTLYFEAEEPDDFRRTGFSKDGKPQHPQIVLGLLVGPGGFPLTYQLFKGDKFEGHTLMPVLEGFKEQYEFDKLVVVADAGLMSNKNVKILSDKRYDYIIGARIKNETKQLQKQILELSLEHGQSKELSRPDGTRLIINYSNKRAKKDEHNRKRGLQRLEKKLSGGKLNKSHINNRGYNKYLKMQGELEITIDYDRFKEDAKWDGLKGYITNTDFPRDKVIKHYKQLWEIERTFRISKSDLKIRPVFHYVKRRIEAHICIAFVACVVFKELERQLKLKNSDISAERAIEILKSIYRITIKTPYSNTRYSKILSKTEEQTEIMTLFDI